MKVELIGCRAEALHAFDGAGEESVTPLGQMPFFIEFVKQGGLFDGLVADCQLHYTSPNAPRKRDVLGTTFLSVLAGHWRYANITTVRCDPVNPAAP
jgi:hypothetical protein